MCIISSTPVVILLIIHVHVLYTIILLSVHPCTTGMSSTGNPSVPILRVMGITMEGNSVCTHIHGFLPYLYVPAPSEVFTPANCSDLLNVLNAALESDSRTSRDPLIKHVLAVVPVQKCSMYGFRHNKMYPFLKITLALPKLIATARRLLERGLNLPGIGEKSFSVFESNIEYEIRFMIDMDVVGCNWIECPKGKYFLRKPSQQKTTLPGGMSVYGSATAPISKCQIELDISYEDFISHAPEGDWQKIAPFRILSFDIECAGRKGVFPEADVDRVIQIANMVVTQGDKEPFIRNVFTLKGCSPIVGSDVRSFDQENKMLQVN